MYSDASYGCDRRESGLALDLCLWQGVPTTNQDDLLYTLCYRVYTKTFFLSRGRGKFFIFMYFLKKSPVPQGETGDSEPTQSGSRYLRLVSSQSTLGGRVSLGYQAFVYSIIFQNKHKYYFIRYIV
jgi:hypothetical protein